jgi:hypothetical protein
LHYAVGAQVKKSISKRSYIVTGLQYSFYSNHLSVGTALPADTVLQWSNSSALAIRNIYRNNGTYNHFTNKFHFIELPVGYEYVLLQNKRLHVQHGLTISQLLSSKVLHYDGQSNTYYQSKSGLRKTGFSLFTAVDYTVWNGKSVSLQVGPQVQYSLQNVFKNTSNSHLLSGGLGVNVSF